MAIEALPMPVDWRPPPGRAGLLIDAARARAARFAADDREARIPALVHSHFAIAHHALHHIDQQRLAPGRRFCEWGSGFGVVTMLASLLGFDALGIEIEPRLVTIAGELAAQQGVAARFACASYRADGDDSAAAAALPFDLVYAYPWPAEERSLFGHFERRAAPGTLLLTYHGGAQLRLHRQPAPQA
jgi:predicted O-methyltransferase YrrM